MAVSATVLTGFQGATLNRVGLRSLQIVQWTPTTVEACVPEDTTVGWYRVRFYCEDPLKDSCGATGTLDLQVVATSTSFKCPATGNAK